jgi:cytochrome c oxidase assembly protein subunit 11
MSGKPIISSTTERSNRVMALSLLAFFAGMVGMAYAAVPLYQLFCQVTGYGGTTQRVTQYSDRVLDQTIKVRFDANTTGVPWDFRPVQREVEIPIGETVQIVYKAKNVARTPTSGRATFNVTPQIAGSYFMKMECFCFTDTTLQPGEELEMPVVFYVDPAIADTPETKNIGTLTLSYTFYPTETDKPVAAAKDSGQKNQPKADEIGG